MTPANDPTVKGYPAIAYKVKLVLNGNMSNKNMRGHHGKSFLS